MSDRLAAEPGSVEFLRQLYNIARASTHPMDVALAGVLTKHIGEKEAVLKQKLALPDDEESIKGGGEHGA